MSSREDVTREELLQIGLRMIALAEEMPQDDRSAEADGNADKRQIRPSDQKVYSPSTLASFALQIYRSRRERDRLLPGGLFKDPAWDMLLELFISHVQKRSVTISGLTAMAACPPTTALRWIGVLEEARLLEREASQHDQRMQYLSLTDFGYWSVYRTLEAQLRIFRGGERPTPVGTTHDSGSYLIEPTKRGSLRAVK